MIINAPTPFGTVAQVTIPARVATGTMITVQVAAPEGYVPTMPSRVPVVVPPGDHTRPMVTRIQLPDGTSRDVTIPQGVATGSTIYVDIAPSSGGSAPAPVPMQQLATTGGSVVVPSSVGAMPVQVAVLPAVTHPALLLPKLTLDYSYCQCCCSRDIRVFGPDGSQVLFMTLPCCGVMSECIVFADESKTRPLVIMRSRGLISFTRDIIDAPTGIKIGAISFQRDFCRCSDQWGVLNHADQEFAILEQSGNVILQLMCPKWTCSSWDLNMNGTKAMRIEENFSCFSKNITLDNSANIVDPRIALCCAVVCILREIQRESNSSNS
jgi:hypothetical protein